MANPTLLTSPIAENGDKNVIPASTGATTGLLDQEHGFQQINELPLQAGGLPPQRKDFNGAFNLLSKLLFYVQKGWQFEFDETQDYYAGCIVKDTDGYMYEALNDVSASSTHPSQDSTKWTRHDLSDYLPLSGGTMTGRQICRNVDNDALGILGATSITNGASTYWYGKDFPDVPDLAGAIRHVAQDSSGATTLVLRPDGTLIFDPDGSGNLYDLGGSSVVAKALGGSGYIKYESGIIIQQGLSSKILAGQSSGTITFPISFTSTDYMVVASPYKYGGTTNCSIDANNKTASTCGVSITSTAGDTWVSYIAIGK